jgi:hypothetical protein
LLELNPYAPGAIVPRYNQVVSVVGSSGVFVYVVLPLPEANFNNKLPFESNATSSIESTSPSNL